MKIHRFAGIFYFANPLWRFKSGLAKVQSYNRRNCLGRQGKPVKTLFRIYREARSYWGCIAFSAATLLLITASNLLVPRLMQDMIAVLERDNVSAESLPEIYRIAAVLLIVYAAQAVLRFFNSYVGHLGAWRFVSQIRTKVYDHLQRLSIAYYHDKQTGQLMSRVVNDTNAFETLIAHAIPDLAGAAILFVGVAAILFATNATLALLTCIPIPFILMLSPLLKKIRAQHRKAQVHIAELNANLQDNFSGIKEIHIFDRQDYERDRVEANSRKHADALMKALLYSAVIHPSIGFFTSLGNVIVVGVGGCLALAGGGKDLQISEIVGFFMYLGMFYGPVAQLARIVEDMQAGIAGGERVFEILGTESEIRDSPAAREAPMLDGRIAFENVSFAYGEGPAVLDGVSFEAPPRQMFALVGPTGVGKTTLVALMSRFYDPTAGRITLDGIDLREMKLESLRKNISVALQDVFLFNATVKENILYGNPEAADHEVEEAARMACIHDFIASLPQGYETVVGERGVRLSGGQKQRISIARSLLCRSSVLLLDEATSAVDTQTEREIQDAIQRIAGSRTLVVIAHRLSTVKKADCILVFRDGGIVERGRHDELIQKGGFYKRLVEIQNIRE